MAPDPEVLAVLVRLLADRANRVADSIDVSMTLTSLLQTDEDWVALQRGIYRNLNCIMTVTELRAYDTVHELASAVTIRVATESPQAPSSEEEQDHLQLENANKEGFTTVRVFYATDRARGERVGFVQTYAARRGDGTLSLGVAEVAIPDDHTFGALEGPRWWQFFSSPNPRKHIMVIGAAQLATDVFWDGVKTCVAASDDRDILLLIHGYNVSFDNGLRRAAQIVRDLKFCGAPVLYSWPSHESVTSYSADEASVAWTVPRLIAFLRQLLEGAGAARVHVIAHSLGNRAAIDAIRELQRDVPAPGAAHVREFVLAAPDVDADTFRQLALDFARQPMRCTLYANTEDRALAVSDIKHGSYPRLGGGGADLLVLPSIDTIDATGQATDFLSHSYYAGSSPVVTDLFHVIRSVKPDERARLQRRQQGELVYWRIA